MYMQFFIDFHVYLQLQTYINIHKHLYMYTLMYISHALIHAHM
jgi:hypothetical protein